MHSSCVGFAVEGPDGPLGTIAAVAGRRRGLAVTHGGAEGILALDDVELVDTIDGTVLVHGVPAPLEPGAPAPWESVDCACPTDFACVSCGYGVAAGHLPSACPMCGGHRWRPTSRRTH